MDEDLWDHLTPVATAIQEADLAVAVARQRLTSRLTDHPVAPLADCVQIGRAVKLKIAEMQRLTGLARQTLYRHAELNDTTPRQPPPAQLKIEALLLISSREGASSPADMAARARLSEAQVMSTLLALDEEGLCDVQRETYGQSSIEAMPNAATYLALREQFDELYLRRPDAISVYVRLPGSGRREIERAAEAVIADLEHTVMEASVAPSSMSGPELGLLINAPTIRRAILITRDVWREILGQAGRPFSEPAIANLIPAGGRPIFPSDVLDAFLEAAADNGAPAAAAMSKAREQFGGGVNDRHMAGRCIWLAALALRRAVGNNREPQPITDGESAFAELQPAHGIPVGADHLALQRAVVAGLELATDKLGPLPAGGLAAFRAPGQAPSIVPTSPDEPAAFVQIAHHAGIAYGIAAALGLMSPETDIAKLIAPLGTSGG
jgi:hypothetical protein